MERWPRISIVTPPGDPGADLGATIESVRRQDYPELQHIVVLTDPAATPREPLAPQPHLSLVAAPGAGHARAVNQGFRIASGEIWSCLPAGHALVPGVLARVARELAPGAGRQVAVGRCRLVDEGGRFAGLELAAPGESHRRVLEAWNGQAVALPAAFWTPEAWRACGPMDESLQAPGAAYDLFCRMTRAYPVHRLDEVLVASPLSMALTAAAATAGDRLEEGVRISRRYWGSPLTPAYWRLALSLARFRFHRVGRSRAHLRLAQERWRRGARWRALAPAASGAILGPEVAWHVVVYPRIRDRAAVVARKTLARLGAVGAMSPETAAHLDHLEPWDDGWVGPRLALTREAAGPAVAVIIQGWADPGPMRRRLVLTVRVSDCLAGRHRIRGPGNFAVRLPLAPALAPGAHTVEVEASGWFVPDRVGGNGDFRPLSWRLGEVRLEGAEGRRAPE